MVNERTSRKRERGTMYSSEGLKVGWESIRGIANLLVNLEWLVAIKGGITIHIVISFNFRDRYRSHPRTRQSSRR